MSEQSSQPDLQDRQLIPARSRVSLSQEIGEAVITHNIFGKARVRIIRKNDKLHRAMWWLALAGAGIIAAAAWQNWVASQKNETGTDVLAVTPGADVAKSAPASHAEASPTLVAQPLVNTQPVTPPQTAPVSAVPVVVVPAKPALAPRPLMVRPQSAPQATNLLAPPQFATSLPPKPVTTKPAVAPALTPVIKPQVAASSAAIAMPLSSPLAKEVAPATGAPAVEPTNLQSK